MSTIPIQLALKAYRRALISKCKVMHEVAESLDKEGLQQWHNELIDKEAELREVHKRLEELIWKFVCSDCEQEDF